MAIGARHRSGGNRQLAEKPGKSERTSTYGIEGHAATGALCQVPKGRDSRRVSSQTSGNPSASMPPRPWLSELPIRTPAAKTRSPPAPPGQLPRTMANPYTCAYPGNDREFDDHHQDGRRHGSSEIRKQERKRVTDTAERRHETANAAAHPGVATSCQASVVGQRFGESHADARADRGCKADSESIPGAMRSERRPQRPAQAWIPSRP